jgi:hypothetical protein
MSSDLAVTAQCVDNFGLSLHGPNLRKYFPKGKENSSSAAAGSNGHTSAMSAEKRNPYDVECGKRLVLARTALGYPKRPQWARLTMPADTEEEYRQSLDLLRKYENGDTLVRPAYIAKLKRLFGIDPNWIYSNDPSRMPAELAAKVVELQDAEADESEDITP